ncbi:MAG TPA: XdhC family protein [Solirubrobacteraceae bacterium]|nr:XdhC family protein [Solirubrobacteraceae bacterium]
MNQVQPQRLSAEQRKWAELSDVHGPSFAADGAGGVRLVCVGAVPLSAALCRIARTIGWAPFVLDPRERFARPERFPDAARVLAAWPAEGFAELGELDGRTAVAALTHAPELDDEALTLALRSPAFYVGALGSRRNQGRRRERLLAAGLSEAELARLRGPAGLDLGGETAGEAALAILAEAVAVLRGREGGPLTSSANAVHVEGRP